MAVMCGTLLGLRCGSRGVLPSLKLRLAIHSTTLPHNFPPDSPKPYNMRTNLNTFNLFAVRQALVLHS